MGQRLDRRQIIRVASQRVSPSICKRAPRWIIRQALAICTRRNAFFSTAQLPTREIAKRVRSAISDDKSIPFGGRCRFFQRPYSRGGFIDLRRPQAPGILCRFIPARKPDRRAPRSFPFASSTVLSALSRGRNCGCEPCTGNPPNHGQSFARPPRKNGGCRAANGK